MKDICHATVSHDLTTEKWTTRNWSSSTSSLGLAVSPPTSSPLTAEIETLTTEREMKRSGEVEAKTKPSGSAKRNQNRGRSKATWACLSCRARKTRSNVALIGSPCYHCAQDDVCCVKPMSRRQKKVRARSEVSPSSYWPQNQPEQESPPSSSHSSTPTAQTQNPFEGEFGFAGDLQAILETHFCAVVPECPCEQFGLLACPFCDTENLSKDVIKGTSRL